VSASAAQAQALRMEVCSPELFVSPDGLLAMNHRQVMIHSSALESVHSYVHEAQQAIKQ
jgi:hypothetical protein